MFLCETYHQFGWVQQFHLGALRNNNARMHSILGPDTGWDSIGDYSQAQKLSGFLNALDGKDKLAKTILYNLNPADNEVMSTMIGNFNDISPSDTMVGSLKKLLTWITLEMEIVATDSTPHPTPADALLRNIAGHRQGCATACPGDSTFRLLPAIRNEVETQRLICHQLVHNNKLINGGKVPFTLNGNSILVDSEIGDWQFYDLSGKLISVPSNNNAIQLKAGIYILLVENSKAYKFRLE